MKATLEALIRKCHPTKIQGWHWFVLSFSGKADLEKNIPRKMRSWNHGEPMFIILRDNDGSVCKLLKTRLEKLAAPVGKPFKIRVVCQELESWFLGDPRAVTAAYPACKFANDTAKYWDPDRIVNAPQELAKLTGDTTKIQRANLIAPHLDPARNRSHSFRVLFETLTQHI